MSPWWVLFGLLGAGSQVDADAPSAAEPARSWVIPDAPSDHALIYYNARAALRDDDAQEALKLWLLRNALESQTHRVSAHDDDLRSVTWAALGELGLCQDGLRRDDAGAGLWPLATYNWLVRNMRRSGAPVGRPFDAFRLDQQQRFVAINDVLSAAELETVGFSRGSCFGPRLALIHLGELPTADLADRQLAARLLRHYLATALETLRAAEVRGRSVVAARLFDVELQLTALAARLARQQERDAARVAREIGLPPGAIDALRDAAEPYAMAPNSTSAAVLEDCVRWPVSEWLALEGSRRLFLFDHARTWGDEPAALDPINLGVLDALIARGEGAQIQSWIARYATADQPRRQAAIWGGERGRQLMALGPEAGFNEVSVIALRRGVDLLGRGDLPGALRALGYALQRAGASRASSEVEGLSRRWISYAASQFTLDDALLESLASLLPRQDLSLVLEDLLWRAALRADGPSFDRAVQAQRGRGALERRAAALAPLASGDVRAFARHVRGGLDEGANETLRLLEALIERLEREDADVRAAHAPTLEAVRTLLEPLAVSEESSRQRRVAEELRERARAMLEGLGAFQSDARDRARAVSAERAVFAGSVRLAPSDPLPWPFAPEVVSPPSIFTPIQLTPAEWPAEDGGWVFGWSLSE